jgi:hypothetical protein
MVSGTGRASDVDWDHSELMGTVCRELEPVTVLLSTMSVWWGTNMDTP